MPVYLRKEEGEPSLQTPSISDFKLKEDDFILDPEILFDYLPQPYRMIDKMLELVLDIAWEQIEEIEAEKARRAAERKIPMYSNPTDIPNCHDVRCVCPSPGSSDAWFYAGTSDEKLAIFDSVSQEVVMEWTEEPVKVKQIKVAPLAESVTVVLAEDENDNCRLFITALDRIHFVKILNETDSFQAKMSCVRSWISEDATAIALYLKNLTSGTMQVEVFKLPVDAWNRELEAANQQYLKQVNSTSDVTATVPAIIFTKPVPTLRVKAPLFPQGVAMTPYEMFKRAEGVVPGSGLLGHQLSLTHMDMANTAFNMLNSKNIHLLPESVTEERHPQVVFFHPGRLTPVGIDNHKEAGRVCSVGIWWTHYYYMPVYSLLKPPAKDIEHKPDSILNFGAPVSSSVVSSDNVLLAFGFSDGSVVLYDKEYGAPQQVMKANFSGRPVSLMGFVEPGIFDLETTDPEMRDLSLNGETERSVPSRLFPSVADGSGFKWNGVVCLCEDGTLSLCKFGKLLKYETKFLCSRCPVEDVNRVEGFSFLPGLPQLLVAVRSSGTVTLFDLIKCQSVCDLQVPNTHQLFRPLQSDSKAMLATPAAVVSLNKSQFLFLYGCCSVPAKPSEESSEAEEVRDEKVVAAAVAPTVEAKKPDPPSRSTSKGAAPLAKEETRPPAKEVEDEGQQEEEVEVRMETHFDLFCFPLRSFRTLDEYWASVPEKKNHLDRMSLESLCRSNFKSRIVDQSVHVERLRKRWTQLRNEVNSVRNVRFNRGPNVTTSRSNLISTK